MQSPRVSLLGRERGGEHGEWIRKGKSNILHTQMSAELTLVRVDRPHFLKTIQSLLVIYVATFLQEPHKIFYMLLKLIRVMKPRCFSNVLDRQILLKTCS